ncbi:DNA-directed RNA polymerase IV subunit [Trifolium repens]|nr:DNA-directed RNA polymerase IV subunit [Trifolium repens]
MAKEGGETSVDKEKDSQDCITTTIVEDSQNSLQLDSNLSSATSDTWKSILPKHLHLVANSLSASGEFVGLSAKGMARQRKHASVSSPFVQAYFSTSFCIYNPGSSFLKAANSGVVDNLQGNLYALAWGNCLPMATSGQFDIIYSEKVREHDKSVDVYGLLEASFDQMDQENKTPQSQKYSSSKCNAEFRYKCGKSRLIDSKFPMLHRQ